MIPIFITKDVNSPFQEIFYQLFVAGLFRAVKWKLELISCHCYRTTAHGSAGVTLVALQSQWWPCSSVTSCCAGFRSYLPSCSPCPICSSPLPQQKEKLSPQPLQFRAWCFSINLPFWLCRTNVLSQEPWWWFNATVCFTFQSWRCSQQQRQIYFFLRKAVPRPWYLLKLPGEVTHYYFLTWLLINLRIISQLH